MKHLAIVGSPFNRIRVKMTLATHSKIPDFYGVNSEPLVLRKLNEFLSGDKEPTRQLGKIRIIGLPRQYDCCLAIFRLPPDAVGLDIWIEDPLARNRFLQRFALERRAVVTALAHDFVVTLTVPAKPSE